MVKKKITFAEVQTGDVIYWDGYKYRVVGKEALVVVRGYPGSGDLRTYEPKEFDAAEFEKECK